MSREPVRTCISCRTSRSKCRLLRIARTSEHKIEVDVQQNKPGRGAYICHDKRCFALALKRNAFVRALQVSPSTEFVEELTRILHD